MATAMPNINGAPTAKIRSKRNAENSWTRIPASTSEELELILSAPKRAPSAAVPMAKIAEKEIKRRPIRVWSVAIKYAAIVPRKLDLVVIEPAVVVCEIAVEELESIAVITQITLTVCLFNRETSLLH
jgi:hypothetical protein